MKKTLAIILGLCMINSVTAFAEDDFDSDNSYTEETVQYEEVYFDDDGNYEDSPEYRDQNMADNTVVETANNTNSINNQMTNQISSPQTNNVINEVTNNETTNNTTVVSDAENNLSNKSTDDIVKSETDSANSNIADTNNEVVVNSLPTTNATTAINSDAIVSDDNNPKSEITVYFDGEIVTFPDTKAQFVDNVVYVPIRAIAEKLGISIDWDGNQKKLRYTTDGKVVEHYMCTNSINIDGQNIFFEIPSINISDRIVMPEKNLSEAIGVTIIWDESTNSLQITSK